MNRLQDSGGQMNLFTGYGDDYVSVNGQRFSRNLIVLPDRIVADWSATSFAALTVADLDQLANLEAEIFIIGTGGQLRFPEHSLLQPFVAKRIALDAMDMHAACRTYNILANEQRIVACAILFD